MANYDDKQDYENEYLEDELDSQKDKYITFMLEQEEYAIEIMYVTEIVGLQKITILPDMPEFIKGVINLRGNVIPIISVRRRFRMEEIPFDERTCIIVVTIDQSSVGLIVDEVSEVLDIPNDKVDPAPRTGRSQNRYIKGIGKVGENVKIILSLDSMLSEEEMAGLAEFA